MFSPVMKSLSCPRTHEITALKSIGKHRHHTATTQRREENKVAITLWMMANLMESLASNARITIEAEFTQLALADLDTSESHAAPPTSLNRSPTVLDGSLT